MFKVNLPEQVQQFYKFDEIENPIRHQEQVIALESFIRNHKQKILKLKQKRSSKKFIDPNQYFHSSFMILSVLKFFSQEIHEVISQHEINSFEEILEIAEQMFLLVCNNPKVIVDINNFTNFLLNCGAKNPRYKSNKFKRRCIQTKIKYIITRRVLPDYLNQIKIEFVSANQRYNPELQYSPPSPLDSLIAEYLYYSPLNNLIKPTSDCIAEGTHELAVYTVSEFALRVYKLLNVSTPQSQSIVYTSIIRMLFDEAYINRTDLRKYNKANSIFLIRAEKYSNQTVRDLKLSESIIKNYTLGLPVYSLYKSKQLDLLKQMEFMTNPIDLMKHVHTIISSLAQYFGSGDTALSFDDTFTLLLGLTSLAPPANAVSISKFVEKWNDFRLSSVVGIAKNYFIAAVEQLLTPEELLDDK